MSRRLRVFWSRLRRQLAALKTDDFQEDFNAELASHIAMHTEDGIRAGLTDQEARRQALLRLGGAEQTRQAHREQSLLPRLDEFWRDVCYNARALRKSPGFAIVAVLSLALGIGATVSVYSVMYAVLVNTWPYAGADRICTFEVLNEHGEYEWTDIPGPQVLQLQQAKSFEGLLAFQDWDLAVTGSDVPESVRAVEVSPGGLQFLGVPALVGRNFTPADVPGGRDAPAVAVLSYAFWQRHYSGDPAVVGKSIDIAQKAYTILGVARPRFTFEGGDVFIPFHITSSTVTNYAIYLKLRRGVSSKAAGAELTSFFQQFAKQRPDHFPKQIHLEIRMLGYYFERQLGLTFKLLLAAVGLLLLIACANVSILLLARGMARQHEFGIRSALGASTGRILRQLLTEALMLALTGAALGVAIAYASQSAIVSRLPRHSFPPEVDFHVNLHVLLFSVVIAIATAVVFGLFPAWQMAQPRIQQALRAGSRKVAGNLQGKRFNNSLIAAQIALTLLLMTAAGTAIASFTRLSQTPLGFNPHQVLPVIIPVHPGSYTTTAQRIHYYARLRDQIASLPDVTATGISSAGAPPYSGWDLGFTLPGLSGAQNQSARVEFVDDGYFRSLQVPLRRGRLWSEAELGRSAPLVVVNETFVKRYLAAGDPLDRSVKVNIEGDGTPFILIAPGVKDWQQIIGVVADVRNNGLDKPVKPAIYLPFSAFMMRYVEILVKGRIDPRILIHSVRQRIATVDADQQIYGRTDNIETWIHDQPEWGRARLVSILFAIFAGLALVLSSFGLYSVVSFSVAQRTSEFAIRIALGAKKSDVLRNVLSAASIGVVSGVVVGLSVSLGMTRLMKSWVEGSSNDPGVVAAAVLVLLATACLACLVPFRRASSVDPITALRDQ
jgi:putative ABC transport system permease protein